MDQSKTPIIDAIRSFQSLQPAFFRIPAHRFERGADREALELLGEKAFGADLTEAEGLDDLHKPEGVIAQAQALAADLFGADRTWFLVNGSTCGNEAMILACLGPGEKILIPRNAHKSVLMGLILSGAVPVWMEPDYFPDSGLYGAVSEEEVKTCLDRHPDCRAVFLVSPTYYGLISPVREIALLCHERGIPLLVDEAHGSHLYFGGEDLGACRAGADLVVQSIHKTGGSMTQSSMLHLRRGLVSEDRLDECLKLVMSTSPSYLLLASLDGARHRLALEGRRDFESALSLAEEAERGLSLIEGVFLPRPISLEGRAFGRDPLRLVFSMSRLGLAGYDLQDRLYGEAGVSLELSDERNVVLVISWGNVREDIDRLLAGVRKISDSCLKDSAFSEKIVRNDPGKEMALPEVVCSPREAFYRGWEEVSLSEAAGRIAAESIIPYPPGIPIVCPGERLTPAIAERVLALEAEGVVFHGWSGQAGGRIRVVREEARG